MRGEGHPGCEQDQPDGGTVMPISSQSIHDVLKLTHGYSHTNNVNSTLEIVNNLGFFTYKDTAMLCR